MPPRHQCFLVNSNQIRLFYQRSCYFHTGKWCQNKNVDYYDALGLEPGASLVTIKKQFYALSKLYHPDRNPNDSEASNRFIKISEAYTILGSTEKRQRYDRDFQRKSREQSSPVQQSSYSDSGPLGSRPASGLSRRRSHFQGPPPSFYRNGGWGSQRPKRQSQAGTTGPAPADVNSKGWKDSSEPYGGWGNDVPHFDKEKHYRRQEQQEQWRQRRGQDSFIGPGTNGSLLINFLWVSGVISAACLIPAILEKRKQGSNGTNDL